MTTAVAGAGPVGLVCAAALAAAGEQVLLFDRDPGPGADGRWRRRGVMQFQHPHFFRHFVRQVLEEHVPQMWDAVLAAGAVVTSPPEGVPPFITTIAARRSTLEAALRRALPDDRLVHVAAHVERVLVEGDRVRGVVARGKTYDVDRVLVATGRAGGLGDDLRPAGESSDCGVSYTSRMYRARPGVEPLASWVPLAVQSADYQTIAFPQDDGTLSALVVRPSRDPAWTPLWRQPCWDAAVAALPGLAPWTDPERFEPITDVLRGGRLFNSYRGQGSPPAGVFFVGDAVCTTNPSAGRGVSLGFRQAAALLDLLPAHRDPKDASAAFDAWCEEQVRPWYDDHLAVDASFVRSVTGQPVDPAGPITSDLVSAAAQVDPSLGRLVGMYAAMVALPETLLPAHEQVRGLLQAGWRPQPAPGPSRDELVELMARVSGPTPAPDRAPAGSAPPPRTASTTPAPAATRAAAPG